MGVSTYFGLLAEFGTSEIPLDRVAGKFFGVHDDREQMRRAAMDKHPVPEYSGAVRRSAQSTPIPEFYGSE